MATTLACERLVTVDDLTCECDLPVSTEVIDQVLDGASDLLASLADVQLGRCTANYRPCRDDWCAPQWCSCCGTKGIHLPGVEPAVTEVWIDGAQLVADTDYRVMISPIGQYVLVRLDSVSRQLSWPSCKNRFADRAEDGTFEIEVESGYEVNVMMTLAAAELACDVFSWLAGGDHILPAGVASATAYGLSMATRLPFDPKRKKGLDLSGFTWVERFLGSLPETKGAEVMSPELDDGWDLWQRA
jgi:hypothetical protein